MPGANPDPRLISLLETLELLLSQAKGYEVVIGPTDVQMLNAITLLRELAEQAYNEAADLNAASVAPQANRSPLSPRQFEVLELVSQGLTNKEIAYRLALSERTIQFHLNEVFNKSGAFSRAEAVAYAFQNGWLPAKG